MMKNHILKMPKTFFPILKVKDLRSIITTTTIIMVLELYHRRQTHLLPRRTLVMVIQSILIPIVIMHHLQVVTVLMEVMEMKTKKDNIL